MTYKEINEIALRFKNRYIHQPGLFGKNIAEEIILGSTYCQEKRKRGRGAGGRGEVEKGGRGTLR